MRLTGAMTVGSRRRRSAVPTGVSGRRQLISAAGGIATLTALTALLVAQRPAVSLIIVFLLYLAAVVAVAAAGGPIVGVIAAVAAFLAVNFFFTEPIHTLNVADAERLAELIIFLAISGTVSALVDTAGKRRYEVLARTVEANELAAANDLRTALLRAVSHDLRTPLATAKIATSSLLAPDVTLSVEDRDELLRLADHEIDRLVVIIENLLEAGRLQAGALTVDMKPTSLDAVVHGAWTMLPEDDQRRVQIQLADAPDIVLVDEALLARVLGNLLTNALAADPTGTIVVRSEPSSTPDHVALLVVDHGRGMTVDDRSQASLPFQRFEDRGGRNGIGLGLPISFGFCEAMGIDLDLSNTPGGVLTASLVLSAT